MIKEVIILIISYEYVEIHIFKSLSITFKKGDMVYLLKSYIDSNDKLTITSIDHIEKNVFECPYCPYFSEALNKNLGHKLVGESICSMMRDGDKEQTKQLILEVFEAFCKKARLRFLFTYNINLNALMEKIKQQDVVR